MNICEHLTATARIFPNREAIRFEGVQLTYADVDQMSLAASQQILAAGIQPGDRLAIMLGNVPAFVVWYYAALRIGAIAVSMSTRSAPSEVAFLLDDCGAEFFVTDASTLGSLHGKTPSSVRQCLATSDLGDSCNDQPLEIQGHEPSTWVDRDPGYAATILYTSGTTGFPKGATLSHMNVRSNVCAFNHLCNMQPDDRILLAVPLFHCFGQNALLNSAFNVGATLVLQRRFDPGDAKRLISEEQVTQLYGVPMMFQILLGSCDPGDLSSVNYCFSAAATLPVQIGQQWQQKFGMPLNEGYGLTETSPFASYNHRLKFLPGSIGTPIDSVEMRVVDTETGRDCPPGELGEIAIRGPNVMLGYWNRDEDTQAAIRDGWFHSGDLGRVDERGYFYIVDRVKDMIAVGGLKVYPAEVERVILDHPAVAQVAVVGRHDDTLGEQVVAFVVLESNESLVDEQIRDIRRHAREHLADYKVPRLVVPIDELPRNASGKILKRDLREFEISGTGDVYQSAGNQVENPTSEQQAPRRPTLRRQLESTHAAGRKRVALTYVQKLAQSLTDSDELPEPNDGFLDAGLDSLSIVEMSNRIQAELGSDHEVPATLVFDFPRIVDLSDYLISELFPTEEDVETAPTDEAMGNDLRQQIEALSEDDAFKELMKELND